MDFRVLNTDADDFPIDPGLLDQCTAWGLELMNLNGHEPDAIADAGATCDALLVYRATVNEQLLERLPRCQVIARCGTGYEQIDLAAARRRGITVTYVPDFCAEEMSDQVLLFVLAFARGLPTLLAGARNHHWVTLPEMPTLRRLQGRTIGILGFGSTGKRTAEKAAYHGLQVKVWTRTPREDALAAAGATAASFEEACTADFVSLHLPLTQETKRVIGREQLALFAPHAVLINTARGALVDTDALLDALQTRRLGGAGLDVTDPEPLPPHHPLWDLRDAIITSHTASLSTEALDTAVRTALDDVVSVLRGERARYPVPEKKPLR
jgi:phosphoglycerate dehydrogenase-like enzyme